MSDQILLFGPGGRNVARLGNFVDKRWMKFVCKRGRMRTKSVSTKMRPLTMSACVAGTLYIARAAKFRYPPFLTRSVSGPKHAAPVTRHCIAAFALPTFGHSAAFPVVT